jgi:CheY-like chemotaxis protein
MPVVLVIDDNPSIALALGVLLSLHDIDVVSAASPHEGVTLLGRTRVDLVIQDMNFAADTTSGVEGAALFASGIPTSRSSSSPRGRRWTRRWIS